MPIGETSAFATTWTRWSRRSTTLLRRSCSLAILEAARSRTPPQTPGQNVWRGWCTSTPDRSGPGRRSTTGFPSSDDEIPLPDWSVFDEADLLDLDDDLRRAFRARAVPEPTAVAYDAQVLADDRRYDVPATIIACEFPSEQLRKWIAEANPYVAELAAMKDVEYVDLPTGHWPQFTKPKELGQAILAAVDRT